MSRPWAKQGQLATLKPHNCRTCGQLNAKRSCFNHDPDYEEDDDDANADADGVFLSLNNAQLFASSSR